MANPCVWFVAVWIATNVEPTQSMVRTYNTDYDPNADANELMKDLVHDATEKERIVDLGTTQAPLRYELLGTRGVNYELNGTVPYLECQYLNRTECDPAKNSSCPATTKCYLENHSRILACLAVYTYVDNPSHEKVTNSMLIVPPSDVSYLGCFTFLSSTKEKFCNENTCVSQSAQLSRSTKTGPAASIGYGFCCCHTMQCNNRAEVHMINPYIARRGPAGLNSSTTTESSGHHTAIAHSRLLGLTWTVLTITMAIACVLLLCIVVIFYCLRRRVQSRQSKSNERSPTSIVNGEENLMMQDIGEKPTSLNIDTRSFELVSQGRFGQVYRAIMTNADGSEEYVAVKRHTQGDLQSYTAEKGIFEDISSLGPNWYPSIVKYYGAQKVGAEHWIITEYHERLSLYDLLKNHLVSISSALRMTLTMVDGLQFLHDERPFYFGNCKSVLIHRDIKSKNILIRRDMTACIADFGLARRFDFGVLRRTNDFLGQVGTRRYMSPEVLEGATEFTPAAFKQMDVYAMALCMWEILSRTQLSPDEDSLPYMMPYEDVVGDNPQIGAMRNVVVNRRIRPLFRPNIGAHPVASQLRDTIEEMWDAEADGRITASCAFQRIWRVGFELAEESEGYHSEPRVMQDMMADYHNTLEMQPQPSAHPTRDPFKDHPHPPPIPNLNYEQGDEQRSPPRLVRRVAPQVQVRTFKEHCVSELDASDKRHMGSSTQSIDQFDEQHLLESDTRNSSPTPSYPFPCL